MPRQTKAMLEKENAALRRRIARLEKRLLETKQTGAVLRGSAQDFSLLFETLPIGVVYQDVNGMVLQANPSAGKILGLTLDQMQGRTSTDPRWRSIHEDGSGFPGETHPAMLALQSGLPVQNVVMGVYNPEAEPYRWININAIPHFNAGEPKPYEVFTSFEDVSDRRLAEPAQAEGYAKLERLFDILPVAISVLDQGTENNKSFQALYQRG